MLLVSFLHGLASFTTQPNNTHYVAVFIFQLRVAP